MSSYGMQAAKNFGIPQSIYPAVSPVAPVRAPSVSTSTPLSGLVAGAASSVGNAYGALGQTVGGAAAKAGQTAGSAASVYGSGGVNPTKTVSPSIAPKPVAQAVPGAAYDYTTDPILQQVQAQTSQALSQAASAALASKEQLAIQYGDTSLANSLGDANTAQAAAQNPYSIFGMLTAQQPKDELALDETLNKGNLFYSGARINQQADLANQYGATRAQDAAQERAALDQITAAQVQAEQNAQAQQDAAESQAYQNMLAQLLANPPSGADTTQGGPAGSGPVMYPSNPTISANPTGGSANKKQGVYAIH